MEPRSHHQIADAYGTRDCDGLFLPAVDNLGVHRPIRQIVRTIESRLSKEIGFVVVDGAQAIGHVPLDLCHDTCDVLVPGCHKWLRAYLPMGLAFYGRRRSRHMIDQTLLGALRNRQIDDPLLRFTKCTQCRPTCAIHSLGGVPQLEWRGISIDRVRFARRF